MIIFNYHSMDFSKLIDKSTIVTDKDTRLQIDEVQIKTLKTDKQTLCEQQKGIRARQMQAQQMIKFFKHDILNSSSIFNHTYDDNNQLKNNNTQLENENKELEQKITELENVNKQLEQKITELENVNKNKKLEQKITELKKNADKDTQLQINKAYIKKLDIEYQETLEQWRMEYIRELSEESLVDYLKLQTQINSNIYDNNNQLKNNKMQLENENKKLKQKITEFEQNMNKEILKYYKKNLKDANKELEQKITKFENAHKELEQKITKFENAHKELNKK